MSIELLNCDCMEMCYMPKIELFNEDCMTVMERYPDNYFDLACVDPPYGIGENGDRNASRGKLALAQNYKSFAGGDKEPPPIEYFNEIQRVSKNQIIWGANHFIDRIAKASPCCGLYGIKLRVTLILQIANWHGQVLKLLFVILGFNGAECYRVI